MNPENRVLIRVKPDGSLLEPLPFNFPQTPEPEDDISFTELWHVLLRRKWIVIGSTLIMFAAALALTLRSTPRYEASSRIEINKENSDMLGLDDMTGMMGGGSDSLDYNVTLQTQANVMKSDSIAHQVTQELGLEKRKEFALEPGWFNADEVNAERSLPLEKAPLRREKIQKVFEKNLTVKTVPGTRMIEVSFLSPDPQVAADVVNHLVNDYMERYFRTRYSATAQASDWLSKQLDDLKAQVESSQEKLNNYQKEAGILGTDENHNVVMAKLEQLNQQLSAAEANRITKEAVYQLTKTGNAELVSGMATSTLMMGQSMPGGSPLSLIQNLRAQQAQLKEQYAQASKKYGAAYPKLIQMRSQMEQLEADIQSEIDKVAARAQNDYKAAKTAEDQIRASFERQKAEANRLNDSAVKYTIMKREVESGRQLYEDMLKKLKGAGVLAGLRSTNIVVVDPARTTAEPARPRYPLNLGLGLGVGLLGGIALAFIRDNMDNSIRTPEQVEMITSLPSLGYIPEIGTNPGEKRFALKKADVSPQWSILDKPSSHVSEAYRSLRTSILLSSADIPPKVILVTSALPQEGKSTTSLNVAIALAQHKTKVLLVDADLRKPTLHTRMGLTSTGLSSSLASRNGHRPDFVQHSGLQNLWMLPAGIKPPFPAEILGSQRMGELLINWREDFDFIVLDTPPILSVTDAVVLSRIADAVLVVVRSEKTTRQSLLRAKEILRKAQAPVIGVVVNGVNVNSPDHYHSYGYYGSEYGKGYYSDEN